MQCIINNQFFKKLEEGYFKWDMVKYRGVPRRVGIATKITKEEFQEAYQKYLDNEKEIDEAIRTGKAIGITLTLDKNV